MSRILLLGASIVLLMDTVIRYCNLCNHFDGNRCLGGMRRCWKFNLLLTNRSCTTENFYFNDRITGLYLFRYSRLSCKRCGQGMFQEFHDLLRETFCCIERNYCNDGLTTLETSSLYFEDIKEKKELND
ncbi:prostate and testis expressed protein 4 isoform X2 [Cricetulus griseus]|uniref:Prostate and testis expressed 13 n=2 Tax=Cricetulus griseus TaxID=10029 RepID=A0A8C2MRI7_CRIGR|nr:prostate and testis expressed protein 4 isoform X2 [Cricetulus griseus]XP_035299992.1 prostate and testis expressed protein 4 isoform X2 [Cricetulus griseus]